MTHQVTQRELAEIPQEQRRVIARWLVERAAQFRPSLVLTKHEAQQIQGVVLGLAVDLFDPLGDDSTIEHAAQVLGLIGGE